jgi:hypothetical protein
MVTWWASPADKANVDLYANFDERNLVPIGYAALAFALGVLAGIVIRRTVPAMASTMVAFVAARIAFSKSVRPHLFAPHHKAVALDPASMGFGSTGSGGHDHLMPSTPIIRNAWIRSVHIVDRSGRGLTTTVQNRICSDLTAHLPQGPPPGATRQGGGLPGSGHAVRGQAPAEVQNALFTCVTKLGKQYHEVVAYQPASRYWAFQWTELGLYLAAAIVLVGACFWLVRRRVS